MNNPESERAGNHNRAANHNQSPKKTYPFSRSRHCVPLFVQVFENARPDLFCKYKKKHALYVDAWLQHNKNLAHYVHTRAMRIAFIHLVEKDSVISV